MAASLRTRLVPSWGLRRRRSLRLVALLACRDEMCFLPGLMANVAPHVDGIVALDDGSSDGSAEFLAERPELLELIRRPRERPDWDEAGNYRALVEAALRQGADWAISLDADERVEREFRVRAERVIRRGEALGLSAYAVRLRDLWDSRDRYRADGLWAGKAPPRLFRLRDDHDFDDRPLHASKVPGQAGRVPTADLLVYHLRMLTPEDRRARRERYERLDPEARWQPREGYAYLTDETGLVLRRVPRRRGFVE